MAKNDKDKPQYSPANEVPGKSNRRRALKALIAGGAGAVLLPERWTRPILNSVLLPAHAQLSCGDAAANPTTFDTAGGPYSFFVPAGVTTVTITALGGAGGAGADSSNPGGNGGAGGRQIADLGVTSCEELVVYVGGAGGDASGGDPGAGGTSAPGYVGGAGGASGSPVDGGGGGGASVVVQGGSPAVIAGGAGGGGAEARRRRRKGHPPNR
jgi:hypothetical protein